MGQTCRQTSSGAVRLISCSIHKVASPLNTVLVLRDQGLAAPGPHQRSRWKAASPARAFKACGKNLVAEFKAVYLVYLRFKRSRRPPLSQTPRSTTTGRRGSTSLLVDPLAGTRQTTASRRCAPWLSTAAYAKAPQRASRQYRSGESEKTGGAPVTRPDRRVLHTTNL